jgi:carboxypeptidase family protein
MKFWLIGFSVLLFTSGNLRAESDRATITGTISNASGAVLEGVEVTAFNSANSFQARAATNEIGVYILRNLPVGEYALECSKAEFAKYQRTGINLAINQVAEIDVVLTIGANTKTVTVTSDAPQLQTQTSSISTNLSNEAITELPLNVQGGRNLSSFMFAFVPGVEGSDYDSHILGSLSKNKEVMIDGTSAVSQIGGYISESSPPMEAVQEFQVTTAGIRADEGRTGGGIFRYDMKSGGNAWHGSSFLYMHNEAFDARSWGNGYNEALCLGAAGVDSAQAASCQRAFGKPADSLYSYGASVGGPIKKNKLFFYSAWERYTFENIGIGGLSSTVPTTAFLNGDFSALLDKSTVLGTDSAGQTVYKGAILDPRTGDVFPGNIILPGSISTVSKKIVDLYTQYYQPLSPGLTNNNALPLSNPATAYDSNQFSIKLDYNPSRNHRVDGSLIYAYIPRLLSDQGGIWSAGSRDGGPMANAYDHNTTAPSLRFRDSWTISNTLLNAFSVTFNRFRNPSDARSREGNWPTTLGLGDFGAGNFPVIKFQGVNSDQHRYVAGVPIDETLLGSQFNDFYAANTFIYDDNLSWVRGRHSYKFGAELRVQQFNSHGDYGVPSFVFDPAQTAGSFGANAGFGFASFLLGDVNQASVSEPGSTYGRRKSVSLYAQDDIKVTPKFTLNLDLRWDFNGRYHEKYGHWSNFDTAAINPATGQPGALEFAQNGSDSFEKKQYYHNFSGALGGAYQLTPKMVARASFSVIYVPLNLNTWGAVPYGFNPGFVLNNQVLSTFNWDSGYAGKALDIGKDPNFTRWGMTSIDPHTLELGNAQQWTVGIQREIGSDLALEVNFIQNHGYHLESGYLAANQPKLSNYTALVQAGQQWSWVTKPGFAGFGWASVAPFPKVAMTWGPLFYVGTPDGNSDYRALQFTVKKRSRHGLSVLASYTYSSSHGDTDSSFEDLYWSGPLQDVYNLELERNTISPFDQTHVVKGFVLYELPFGRGKALISDAGTTLNALAGGWTVSGGFHYNTGFPIRITANTYYPGINNVYADIVPGCEVASHFNGQVGGTYFNPSCFVNPPYGEFGNVPGYLSQLRNPGVATEDAGLSKDLRIAERYQLSVRFQLFNVFNRHGFAGPNTQIGSTDFGKITYQNLNGNPGPRVGQFGARFTF